MTACYTDKISVAPGETFTLHASSASGDCALEIARVGGERLVVHRARVAVGDHERPEHADAEGCGWPACCTVTVGTDWASGYYDIALSDADGGEAHHFVCVRAPASQPGARAVLVLSTNTLFAYNYWGGASAYAHVESLMARQATLPEAMENAIGRLSTQRPIAPLLIDTISAGTAGSSMQCFAVHIRRKRSPRTGSGFLR